MTTLRITNYEALHGWGVARNRLTTARARMTDVAPALRSVEDKLFKAYNARTTTTTTVDLTDPERAVFRTLVSGHVAGQEEVGHTSQATPHLRTLVDKLA
jgi:hypothetical protein